MIATPRPPSTFGRLVDFAYTRRPGFEIRLMPAMERSRFGPNFSSRTRFLPTSASSTFQPVMKPSCLRISAMCDLILLDGITTVSWYAELALRRRVSMSAIGSVMVITWPEAFLAAVSPIPGTNGVGELPAALGDAGQLPGVRHLSEADPAETELAVDRVGSTAALAAGVTPHR